VAFIGIGRLDCYHYETDRLRGLWYIPGDSTQ